MKVKLIIALSLIVIINTSKYNEEKIDANYKLFKTYINNYEKFKLEYINKINSNFQGKKVKGDDTLNELCNNEILKKIENDCMRDNTASEYVLNDLKKEFNEKNTKQLNILKFHLSFIKEDLNNMNNALKLLPIEKSGSGDDLVQSALKEALGLYHSQNDLIKNNQDDKDIDSILTQKAYIDMFAQKYYQYQNKYEDKNKNYKDRLEALDNQLGELIKFTDKTLDKISNMILRLSFDENKLSKESSNTISKCLQISEISKECKYFQEIEEAVNKINKYQRDLSDYYKKLLIQ